jgi:hypothetical protein
MNDILHRIRWPNVARAAAVLATVALLASWPHLRGSAPELPPATAAPAAVEPVGPATDDVDAAKGPAAAAARRKPSTATRPKAKAPAAHRRPTTRHRARRSHRPTHRSTPALITSTASAPPPAYVAPAPSLPPGAEFRP